MRAPLTCVFQKLFRILVDMRLLVTAQLLETVERHLSVVSDDNVDKAEISAYFARIASITLFADMENQIKLTFHSRLSRVDDGRVTNFIYNTHEGMFRRAKRKEISDSVALFGPECKDAFGRRISEVDLTKYANVVSERHMTAHGPGGSVTIAEVREAVAVAELILEAVSEAIN